MNPAIDRPGIPLLRYPGSKNQMAAWILEYIPRCHDLYAEPFGGSGAVLLAKERSPMEVYNDRSDDLWNFMRTMRDNRQELIDKIYYTPWSSAEYQLCQQPCDDPIERARRFYFRCWASIRPFDNSHSFRRQKFLSRGKGGDKSPMTPAAIQFTRTNHLYWVADRLRGVVLECMDAIEFIGMYDHPNAFFYVDPPYPIATRAKKGRPTYPVEMMGSDEHILLATTLNGMQGMAIVSGYADTENGEPNTLYQDLFEKNGWTRVDREARIDGGGSRIESLWISPHTWAALAAERSTIGQLALFVAL